jgi:CBS domain-containing membrane protein
MIDARKVPKTGSGPSTVADLMRRDVVTASPANTVRELVDLLRRHGISGAPVVDQARRVVGMVSETDLMWLADWFAEEPGSHGVRSRAAEHLDQKTVGDVMTADVFGVASHASLAELAAFFARTGLGRAVVLKDGKLLGIVSAIDLLGVLADRSET